MPTSRAEIYLHIVWATYQRLPLVQQSIERELYACMMDEARRLRCEVLAIGGMPDHIHLAVRCSATLAPAHLMQRVKGLSSTVARQRLVDAGELFGWQDGYGVFSFSRSHLNRVVAYIRNQRRHHADGDLWTDWELIGD